MFWAQLYLAVFLVMNLMGFLIDARRRRSPIEFWINVIGVLAPALLVLAYLEQDLLTFPASILALMGISIASSWLSGRMYLREFNQETPEDEAFHIGVIVISSIIVLVPAFVFGAFALSKMG